MGSLDRGGTRRNGTPIPKPENLHPRICARPFRLTNGGTDIRRLGQDRDTTPTSENTNGISKESYPCPPLKGLELPPLSGGGEALVRGGMLKKRRLVTPKGQPAEPYDEEDDLPPPNGRNWAILAMEREKR